MRYVIFGILFLSFSVNSFAGDIYSEVSLSSSAGIRLQDSQLSTQLNSAQLKIQYEQSEWLIKFDGRVEYDAVYDWNSVYSDEARDEYRTRFWLNDGYISWQGDNLDVAFGYQKVVWGQADELRVVDVVNPLDFKDFVLFDLDEYRISLPMIRLETSFANWDWQGLGILKTEPNRFPPAGSEFSLLPENIDKENLPTKPEYGLRGQSFWLDTDIALYTFRGYNDNPVFTFPNSETQLDYKRETLWGVSASRPLGDWVARTELARFIGRAFNNTSGGLESSDVTQWLLGLDYLYQDWLISAQATNRNIEDWTPTYVTNKKDPFYTLIADGRLQSDTINLRFAITHADSDGGGQLYQIKLRYRPIEHWEWRANLDILSGDPNNIFGQFRDNDRVWLSVTYTF